MNPTDPYRLDITEDWPRVVNFSGGRSSAYMLYHILQAHGGTLPDHIRICFANTGKEREETFAFIEQISRAWNVHIDWLEYNWRREAKGGIADPKHHYRVVDFHTAARAGEPFAELIEAKAMLPNVAQRFCTSDLKVKTIRRFCRRALGWPKICNVLGMRADETRRIDRSLFEECVVDYPMFFAGVTKPQVLSWWEDYAQKPGGFDLQIHGDQGNCDLCFLKGKGKLIRLLHEEPHLSDWWRHQEERVTGLARRKRSKLRNKAKAQFSQRQSYEQLLLMPKDYTPQLTNLAGLDGEDMLDEGLACFCTD